MKKIFALVLSLVMIFGLCACGNSMAPSTEPQTETFKMGLITLHDNNSTYDKNFIEAFNLACEAKGVEAIVKSNVGESSEAYDAAAELVDAGCKIVFADSFGHEDFLLMAAKEFPEVEFAHATGTQAHTAGVANFHNAFAAIYEGRYLDGVALAMKMLEMGYDSPKVGYIGAFPYAEVISGYTSFFLGVRSVCPEATMEVIYTNSWYDETAEKEAANKLIADGCVGISGHADSMGAPTACEASGVPFVFYNGSVIDACPNTFIVSTKIDWQPYFEYLIDCVRIGTPIDVDWTGTVGNGSVKMTEVNTNIAAEGTDEVLNSIITMMETGTFFVFDCEMFTVDGENISEYMADVDTDVNYTPDTQVILDGIFFESKFRSAPYFDMIIDGISIAS